MFAAILFAANICVCIAQDRIRVKGVVGSAYIYGDISENQAREKAIEEAKKEALKKAHIAENISAYEQLYTTQVNDNFAQFFSSDVQSEIQGAVDSCHITDEHKEINPTTNIIEYKVTLNAEVIKYDTKADYSFKVQVDSIQKLYKQDDKLTFSLKTTQNCYLTIFNITDHDASVMYPNVIEKDQFIPAETQYSFPRKSRLLDYVLETAKDQEMNRLIFVFTKKRIPYLAAKGEEQLTTKESILSWIYSMPPDQRCLFYQQFYILSK
jgi:hypothetical protein